MRLNSLIVYTISLCLLVACGGGSGGENSSSSSAPNVRISPLNISIDGKQFGEIPPSQRVTISYNRNVVSIVGAQIKGDAKFEGRNIFSASSDSSNSFVDIIVSDTGIDGGTYTDELILTPILNSGPSLADIVVDLTFVQEPTQRLTAEINDPNDQQIEITEDGPPVRVSASVNTGPTIRWEVQPLSYIGEDIDVITTDPRQGVGSEQIEFVVTPSPRLIEDVRAMGPNFPVAAGLQDLDHPGNFTEVFLEVSLAEEE